MRARTLRRLMDEAYQEALERAMRGDRPNCSRLGGEIAWLGKYLDWARAAGTEEGRRRFKIMSDVMASPGPLMRPVSAAEEQRDQAELAEWHIRWFHQDGTECLAGWNTETGECGEGGGPVSPRGESLLHRPFPAAARDLHLDNRIR